VSKRSATNTALTGLAAPARPARRAPSTACTPPSAASTRWWRSGARRSTGGQRAKTALTSWESGLLRAARSRQSRGLAAVMLEVKHAMVLYAPLQLAGYDLLELYDRL
jgi:hypothetical protein